MKIIINASNISIGGGIQVSLSIINELKAHKSNEYHVFLSPKVSKQLNLTSFPSNFFFYNFEKSPSNLFQRRKVLNRLSILESKISPNLVFTVFGPSYWRPKKTLHFVGFADGWCYTPKSIAFKKLSFINFALIKLITQYKNFYIKKHSDFLIVETLVAKNNIIKYLKFNSEKIYVVGNTYSKNFNKYKLRNNIEHNKNEFKLLSLCSFFPHKNLSIIKDVLRILQTRSKTNFIFHLTIEDKIFQSIFGNTNGIINLGPQKSEDCPKLYENVDAMFLPTLLETFSASYPEAMKMKKPILTSNLDFAFDICGGAAVYFDPSCSEDIADKILMLSKDENLYQNLVDQGTERLKKFETPETRVKKYLGLFEKHSVENTLN